MENMFNVFVMKTADKMHVELSDGRIMPLEVLIRDYERLLDERHVELSDGRMMPLKVLIRDYEKLLKEKSFKKAIISEPKADKSIASKLKVGEWFRIDRNVIDKSREEICYKCNEAGISGEALWKRFEKSNKIADENPKQYTRLIKTYIFEHNWEYKTEREMRYICRELGRMCDEVICDLELQMRICNGESVNDLVKKADKLPYMRFIKLRDGGTGFFGGSTVYGINYAPSELRMSSYKPTAKSCIYTPYVYC